MMEFNLVLINGKKHRVKFDAQDIKDVRIWLNKHDRFMSIGDHSIVNVDYIVDMEIIEEEEDESVDS